MIIAVYLDLFAYILPAKYSTLLLSKLILLPFYPILHLLIKKFIHLTIKDREKIAQSEALAINHRNETQKG
jgi:hypothetical protein